MILKEVEFLIEGPVKKKILKAKKLKARPRKVLWYAHSGLWHNDLQHTRPDYQFYAEESEEQTVYALDPEQTQCYGAWYPNRRMGVTFHTPRLKHTVVNPRVKISAFKG